MKILVACEYSGRIRSALRAKGHDAWSCDLFEDAEDGSPFHLKQDCLEVIKWGGPWDGMVAHPPCTYLAVSGMHRTVRGLRDPQLTEDALDFVRALMDSPIPRIAIENPVSVISTRIRKPDQIIQPWWFGDDASKKTCLWLKGLPKLVPTDKLPGDDKTRRANQTASGQNKLSPGKKRWKERSRTYLGIADAIANQWFLS